MRLRYALKLGSMRKALLLLFLAVTSPMSQAIEEPADGIGKRSTGREIAAVMGWQGAARLE